VDWRNRFSSCDVKSLTAPSKDSINSLTIWHVLYLVFPNICGVHLNLTNHDIVVSFFRTSATRVKWLKRRQTLNVVVYRLEIQSVMLVFFSTGFVNHCPSNLLTGLLSPLPSPLPCVNKYTVWESTVCIGGEGADR
jgi:hypothetical protein